MPFFKKAWKFFLLMFIGVTITGLVGYSVLAWGIEMLVRVNDITKTIAGQNFGIFNIFLGIGGGPEGVLAACALDAFNCKFQGRFLFEKDEDKKRALEMGIEDFTKKYNLNDIVKGESIFCATGITSGLSLIHI